MDAEPAAAAARVSPFTPRAVDVSSDSLSTFASEHSPSASPPATPRQPEPAAPEPARNRPGLLLLLSAIVVAQAAVIAWLWWSASREASPPPTTATVTITSDPPGRPIKVDGIASGQTPSRVEVAPGPHTVTLGGDATWSHALDAQAGQQATLHVAGPAPAAAAGTLAPGALAITTQPAGLAVTVDGQARGLSPLTVTGLQPGRHEIAVTRDGSVVRRTVSTEAGFPTAVLISTGEAGVTSGWLTVRSPVPVRIEEAGILVGNSDTPRILLPVGAHTLDFVNETFGYRQRRAVQVTNRNAASVALDAVDGSLSVNAQPWAEVWVDGQRIGETPIGNLPLAIGNHELVLRHPQFGERRRTVAVTATAPVRVGIDLRQPQ